MPTSTPAVPVQKRGFFHMLGLLWDAGSTVISSVDKLAQSAEDLADTVNLHTQHIKLSTEVELNSELSDLQTRLTAS